jgi:hypothetical protein
MIIYSPILHYYITLYRLYSKETENSFIQNNEIEGAQIQESNQGFNQGVK